MKKLWLSVLLIICFTGCASLQPLDSEKDKQVIERLNQVNRLGYQQTIDDFNILNPSSSAASNYGRTLRDCP